MRRLMSPTNASHCRCTQRWLAEGCFNSQKSHPPRSTPVAWRRRWLYTGSSCGRRRHTPAAIFRWAVTSRSCTKVAASVADAESQRSRSTSWAQGSAFGCGACGRGAASATCVRRCTRGCACAFTCGAVGVICDAGDCGRGSVAGVTRLIETFRALEPEQGQGDGGMGNNGIPTLLPAAASVGLAWL